MGTELLSEIASKIRKLREDHAGLLRRASAIAKELGDLLLRAKPLCGRQWAKWLAIEFDMTTECAHRYTKIAENWTAIQNHEQFPTLGVSEMFDVACDRPIRKRQYKVVCRRLDTLLDALDQRLAAIVSEYPELEELMDAIDKARPVLEKAGVLKSGVEFRKLEAKIKKREYVHEYVR